MRNTTGRDCPKQRRHRAFEPAHDRFETATPPTSTSSDNIRSRIAARFHTSCSRARFMDCYGKPPPRDNDKRALAFNISIPTRSPIIFDLEFLVAGQFALSSKFRQFVHAVHVLARQVDSQDRIGDISRPVTIVRPNGATNYRRLISYR
ncbi:MAG TPA: hypothetical protein VG326_03640 [Tepidisphaeraceae bacterium]|nr:hypothetical protein [Tepidisphaeraceae bacterium]